MRPKSRLYLFLPSAAVLAGIYIWGIFGVPAVGHYRGPYGDAVNAATVPERHITDAVTAVNFDFRGFDTLGEEFIMFVSVVGVVVLLRQQAGQKDGQQEDKAGGRRVPPPSDAVRTLTVAMVGPLAAFGIYIVTHGQLTPGGGFQGGVILATAPLLIYLAGEFSTFKRVAPHLLIEVAEALGAGGYALVGIMGLLAGLPFLTNVLPLGKVGDVFSSGTVLWIDLAVGLEVSAGFLVLMWAFLEEALEHQE
ncbi:MAG TPA: MnhB domain-containing protein [Bryobacteraceae bacterium]|jgi:multicomponent Na+:H+ antiporter subunit B